MNRRTGWFIAAFILLLASSWGLRNGLREWSGAENSGERVAALVEAGYGFLGLLTAAALYTGHPATRFLFIAWAVFITATGALAPVVWGGAPVTSGIAAGVASAAIAAFIVWLGLRALKAGSRTPATRS
jgi:hypothetical protein